MRTATVRRAAARPAAVAVAAIAAAALGPAAGSAGAVTADRLPRGGERVALDPAGFTTAITNPYSTMRAGTRWVYRETDPSGARQRIVVTVTHRTKRIANGVVARVVRDVATERGAPAEV